jgi:hypothetical protein
LVVVAELRVAVYLSKQSVVVIDPTKGGSEGSHQYGQGSREREQRSAKVDASLRSGGQA